MSWLTSYTMNAGSGALFVAVGILAAFLAKDRALRALAYFLMVWGASLTLQNAAADSTNYNVAFAFFRLAQMLLLLQAIFLLYHVSQVVDAGSPRQERFYNLVRWTTWILTLWGAVGLALMVAWPSAIFDAGVNEETGTHFFSPEPLSPWLFMGPNAVGGALALLLLGWHVSKETTRTGILLLTGLGVAWTYSLGYNLFLGSPISSTTVTVITWSLRIGFYSVAIGLPLLFAWLAWKSPGALRWYSLLAVAAIVAASLLAWQVRENAPSEISDVRAAWMAPGVGRMAALAWLVPAVWMYDANKQPSSEGRLTQKLASVGALLIVLAAGLLMSFKAAGLKEAWRNAALTFGLIGTALVGIIGLIEMRYLSLPRTSTWKQTKAANGQKVD